MPGAELPAELRDELRALSELAGSALRARWADVFGRPASPDLSTALLRQSLAHRRQEQVLGGVPPAALKALFRLADAKRPAPGPPLPVGLRLVREWHGERHVVEVVPDGVRWQGRTYPSLSAVARALTGTRWSGPRFFGLHDARTPRRPRPD